MDYREPLRTKEIWEDDTDDDRVRQATDLANGVRLAIMNPPFSNKAKMGNKFTPDDKASLRRRVDGLYAMLDGRNMGDFDIRNSLRPVFVALAHQSLKPDGIMAFICPTIALTSPSGIEERLALARHYHVDMILACMEKGNVNMSANTGIDESLVIMRRRTQRDGNGSQDTKTVLLDRFPKNEEEALNILTAIRNGRESGPLGNGWGYVSFWSKDLIDAGNWSCTVMRDTELIGSAISYASGLDGRLVRLAGDDQSEGDPHASGQLIRGGSFQRQRSNGSIKNVCG